jgi:hypothetical protein
VFKLLFAPQFVLPGDVDHFDLSIWAFEKLASVKLGVIAL